MFDNRPIGVLDSGVGGLTVTKELQRLLPNESIYYFGDNANVPYGNKSEEEIYKLTKNMVDFLIEKDVKLILVACNTISTIIDKYFQDYELPIIGIIKPAVDYVINTDIKEIGVIATKFTIETGVYERLIKKANEDVKVVSEGSPNLSAMIDSADYSSEELQSLVDLHMDSILEKCNLKDIVLGCTHYPIAINEFQAKAPNVKFINPAYEQVRYAEELMLVNDSRAKADQKSIFKIFTSGKKEVYKKMIDLLDMNKPEEINIV